MRKLLYITLLILLCAFPIANAQEIIGTCGVLEWYPTSCLGFFPIDETEGPFAVYILENYGEFESDDTVFVKGLFDPDILAGLCFAFYLSDNLIVPCTNCCIERGDVDGIGNVNILDLTYTVDFIFRGGLGPPCEGQADVNSDGESANIQDLTFLVDLIFRGGPYPESCPSSS